MFGRVEHLVNELELPQSVRTPQFLFSQSTSNARLGIKTQVVYKYMTGG